jgi:hypothetical protein
LPNQTISCGPAAVEYFIQIFIFEIATYPAILSGTGSTPERRDSFACIPLFLDIIDSTASQAAAIPRAKWTLFCEAICEHLRNASNDHSSSNFSHRD